MGLDQTFRNKQSSPNPFQTLSTLESLRKICRFKYILLNKRFAEDKANSTNQFVREVLYYIRMYRAKKPQLKQNVYEVENFLNTFMHNIHLIKC